MASRETADFLHLANRAARLLAEALPKMQPSALKHEYLTSVANALNHPVASEVEPQTGVTYSIGFGDFSRTLPLVLIHEAPPDNTVRHAYVPNINDPRQLRLVRKLQEHEHAWARERGLPRGRDILAELRFYPRQTINDAGIVRYPAPPPFNEEDLVALANGAWYPTRTIDPNHEVNHSGPPDLSSPQTEDYARTTGNLAQSIDNTNARTKLPKVRRATVKTPVGKTVQVQDIELEPRSNKGPEL